MIAVRSASAAPTNWRPCHTQAPNLILKGQDAGLKIWTGQTPWLMELRCGDKAFFAQAFHSQTADLIVHIWQTRQGAKPRYLGQGSFAAWGKAGKQPVLPAVSRPRGNTFRLSFRLSIEGVPQSIDFNS